jgi:hypothetical protein
MSKDQHLYTYLPKKNTASVDGILSTRLAPAGWEKYKQRSGLEDKEAILAWLNELDPSFKRSDAISVLTEPISSDAHPDIKAFHDSHELYKLPSYKELLKLHIARKIRRINRGRRGTTAITYPQYKSIDWGSIQPGTFLMSNVPHYLVELENGKVPPEYITKVLDKED